MDEDNVLIIIANALDLIHKEMLMRNAYDTGLISKEHYQNYLETFLYIPNKEDNEDE